MNLDESNQEFADRSANLILRLVRLFFVGYGLVIAFTIFMWIVLGIAFIVAIAVGGS